ncbi:MAG TPA: DUF86 domain-containing protein [Methanocorpusculum sp.]|nr:DUF86 domain-containing protein [Methanocorpusculum sp.]
MTAQEKTTLLKHILREIDYIIDFTQRISYEQYSETLDYRYALTRSFEIIGEAANKLTRDYHNHHPEIEWSSMVGNRNVLIHGYEVVDYDVLWTTAVNDIPQLRRKIEKLLREELSS